MNSFIYSQRRVVANVCGFDDARKVDYKYNVHVHVGYTLGPLENIHVFK